MTSGMQRGDLLIWPPPRQWEKQLLLLHITLNACKNNLPVVGIFSLEMSSEQLVLRMLSSESRIPHQKIRNALVSSDEWMSLTNHAGKLAESKMFIDDTASMNIMELRAKARKLKAKEDIRTKYSYFGFITIITRSLENRLDKRPMCYLIYVNQGQ
jgi:replicative DNA helicase